MNGKITLTTKAQGNPVRIKITGGKVSQQETRQAKQYSPNSYHTEYSFELEEAVDIDDLMSVAQINRQANALMGLCTIVNRKSQVRDGIEPFISDSCVKAAKVNASLDTSAIVDVGQEQNWVKNELAAISGAPTQQSTPVSTTTPEDKMEVVT